MNGRGLRVFAAGIAIAALMAVISGMETRVLRSTALRASRWDVR